MNRLLPLATPKLSQPGNQLPSVEVEFIDQPRGFKSTGFDFGWNFFSVNWCSKMARPSLHKAALIPFSAEQQIASCCCLADLKWLQSGSCISGC